MQKSSSISKINSKKQPQAFNLPLKPDSKLHNPHKDPFENLDFKVSNKLMPVSPSGIKLPRIQSKTTISLKKKSFSTRNLTYYTPRPDTNYNYATNKSEKNQAFMPNTPIFRIRDQHINNISYRPRKTESEANFTDISFGNSN
jgi:hypothetical protein